MSHYRDRDSLEVDLIVEARGRVAAVEVRAGAVADPTAVLSSRNCPSAGRMNATVRAR
ncbi:MAG: hypothetical protein ACRDRP_02915 [Pseudonocardiaceae bacterium]